MDDYGKLAQDLYAEYFPQFGSTIIKMCTLNFYRVASYDVTVGENIKDLIYTQPIDIIFTSIKDTEVENAKVLTGDKKALFPYLSVTSGTEITMSEEIVDSDSKVWVILSLGVDPASAGYSLHVRRRPENA